MTAKNHKGRKGIGSQRTIRKKSDGSVAYDETRGIRNINVGLDAASVRAEANKDDVSAKAKLLLYAAGRLLQKAGEKSLNDVIQEAKSSTENEFTPALNNALTRWIVELRIRYGLLSPVSLAASLLAHSASLSARLIDLAVPKEGLEDVAADKAVEEQATLMKQIYNLADAWHWFHMEVFGEHQLAFAKMKHAAGQAKGARTTASKGAKRATIVRTEIVAARLSGKVNMKSTSAIAKAIKPAVDAECVRAGLPVSVGSTAFEKLVGNIIKVDRKG
jgi:hypothetical protein